MAHLNGLNEHSEHLYEAEVNILTSQAGDAVDVSSSIKNNNAKLPMWTIYNWALNRLQRLPNNQSVKLNSTDCLFFIFIHNLSGSVLFFLQRCWIPTTNLKSGNRLLESGFNDTHYKCWHTTDVKSENWWINAQDEKSIPDWSFNFFWLIFVNLMLGGEIVFKRQRSHDANVRKWW